MPKCCENCSNRRNAKFGCNCVLPSLEMYKDTSAWEYGKWKPESTKYTDFTIWSLTD